MEEERHNKNLSVDEYPYTASPSHIKNWLQAQF
jgi:hypothetical protein